jgi:fused signal recognition particle receptor
MLFGFGRKKKQDADKPAEEVLPAGETPAEAEPSTTQEPEERGADAAVPVEPETFVPDAPAPVEADAEVADEPEAIPAPVFVAPPAAEAPAPQPKRSWLGRLTAGLTRSSSKLTEGIGSIFTKRKLDDETLEQLEELLITADMGPATAAKLTAALAKNRFGKEITSEEVREFLAGEIAAILKPVARPLEIQDAGPHVLLMVGVNGTGKTTTIGKLSQGWRADGRNPMLCAADTFRAAAVEQLKVWGERTGSPVIAGAEGADAAGLAFSALEQARSKGNDILMVDTAGRLHNKKGLMDELTKIVRVIRKIAPDAPHSTLLTLDATTGQNAVEQVRVFKEMVEVSGLILTKLDGSAKGGVIVALAQQFGLPVHFIGVGETADDLRPFDAEQFARSLMGLSAVK